MLSKPLIFILLLWFSALSLNSFGQGFGRFGGGGGGTNGGSLDGTGGVVIPPINIRVDRDVIETQTRSFIVTVQIMTPQNDIESARLALSSATLRMVANKPYNGPSDIHEGLFFRPLFGNMIERKFIGNEANLFRDNNNQTVDFMPDIQNTYREAKFEFYIKPESIPSGLKPGKYETTYSLQLRSNVLPRNLFFKNEYEFKPKTVTVAIEVLPYLIARRTAGNPVLIDVNAFSVFESGFDNGRNERVRQSYTVKHNIPINATLAATRGTFAFSNREERNDAQIVGGLTGVIETSGPHVTTANSKSGLSTAGFQHVVSQAPVGNLTNVNIDFEIPRENLSTQFLQYGSYITEANVTFRGQDATVARAETFDINPIEVRTAELRALVVNERNVDIAFRTQKDYNEGVSVDVPNNITFSSTSKYRVTVRSLSETFTASAGGKAVLRSNLLSIGSSLPNSGSTEVQLSTSPQTITVGNPVLKMNSGIRYTVKPNSELIKAKLGTYSIDVIYGITAQ